MCRVAGIIGGNTGTQHFERADTSIELRHATTGGVITRIKAQDFSVALGSFTKLAVVGELGCFGAQLCNSI